MTVGRQALLLRQALSYLVLLSQPQASREHSKHIRSKHIVSTLRKSAYDTYSRVSKLRKTFLTLKSGVRNKDIESRQFAFWSLIFAMELAILTLIRSFREADLVLYREALSDLIPISWQTTTSTTHGSL